MSNLKRIKFYQTQTFSNLSRLITDWQKKIIKKCSMWKLFFFPTITAYVIYFPGRRIEQRR